MSFTLLSVTPKTSKSHIDSIVEFIWREWGDHYDSLSTLESEIKDCAQPNTSSLIIYALLEEENKVCGSISLLENDLDSHADFSPWLANFFVLPEYRNRGIGRALYEALIKEAFENLQYEACYLYTENPSPYESKKWITIGQFQYRNKLQYLLKLTDNILS